MFLGNTVRRNPFEDQFFGWGKSGMLRDPYGVTKTSKDDEMVRFSFPPGYIGNIHKSFKNRRLQRLDIF